MAGDCPQAQGGGNTHLKVLKIKRLQVFQDDSKLALFSAGSELAEIGNTLGYRVHTELRFWRHEDCPRASKVR